MLRPMLFIGVGGSGGKTLRAISHSLNAQLEAAGYSAGIPDAWQFLHIDSTVVQDGIDFPAPMLKQEDFHALAPAGTVYIDLLARAKKFGDERTQKSILSGWAIAPPAVQINTSRSMARAIGRLALLCDITGVKSALENSTSKMSSPIAQTQLMEVAGSLPNQQVGPQPDVYIFSSMGGPTGSGIFQGVSEILKRSNFNDAGKPHNILLYTSDVFRSIGGGFSDVVANSLGVLNELESETLGVLSQQQEIAYKNSGLAPRDDAPRNHYYFLTSRSFQEDASSDPNPVIEMHRIYLSAGKAIANSIMHGDLVERISDLPLSNRIARASKNQFGLEVAGDFVSLWELPELTSPILQEVSKSQNSPGVWSYFWEGRRTGSLVASIPLSTEVRRSIITGWFIAGLFGLREIGDLNGAPTVQIWNPTLSTPGWSTFPAPLPPLGHIDLKNQWILPSLFKAISISLGKSVADRESERLDAYRFLLYLGREVTTEISSRDTWGHGGEGDLLPNGEISKSEMLRLWAKKGVVPTSRPLLPVLASRLKDGQELPIESMTEVIALIQNQYMMRLMALEDAPWHAMPETWELKEDIEMALGDIHTYLDSIAQENICLLPNSDQ